MQRRRNCRVAAWGAAFHVRHIDISIPAPVFGDVRVQLVIENGNYCARRATIDESLVTCVRTSINTYVSVNGEDMSVVRHGIGTSDAHGVQCLFLPHT